MAQGAKTRRGARSYLHGQGRDTLAVGHERGAGMMRDGWQQGCGGRGLSGPMEGREGSHWMGGGGERVDNSLDNGEGDDEHAPLLDAGTGARLLHETS